MRDKINKEERLSNLRKLHDSIKENPFWLTFDKQFLPELGKEFYNLALNVWGASDDTNPYYVVLRGCTHDFCCMSRSLEYYVQCGMYDKYKDAYIITMQAFLQNVHCLIDNVIPDDKVLGYLPNYNIHNESHLTTLISEWFEDEGKYRCLNLIKQKSIEGIKKWLSDRANLKYTSYTTEWARECLQEIEEGKTIIGKYWKIKQ